MKMANSWKALYLASATPMQMEVHEAWDLLDLLGLHGLWGESADVFTRVLPGTETQLRRAGLGAALTDGG